MGVEKGLLHANNQDKMIKEKAGMAEKRDQIIVKRQETRDKIEATRYKRQETITQKR